MLKRIVFLGSGAVGGSMGGSLAKAKHQVTLLARGQHFEKISQYGLKVKLPEREFIVHPPTAQTADEIDWREGDLVVLATKTQDAEAALNSLQKYCPKSVPIACATNGVQAEKWAKEKFENVISVMVWIPATYLHPGQVAIYATGSIGVLDVGAIQGENALNYAQQLSVWLEDGGFDSKYRDDIDQWKYAKWLTNLGNTAQALVIDDWVAVAKAAQAEGEAILAYAGINHIAVDQLLARTQHVRQTTIDQHTREGGSTWQSLKRGKTLESNWIEGAMARLAEKAGIDAPVNRSLAAAGLDGKPVQAKTILGKV